MHRAPRLEELLQTFFFLKKKKNSHLNCCSLLQLSLFNITYRNLGLSAGSM